MYMNGSDKGGYIFISHSHQDIVKVRQIRNAMEEEGYEPLCFYLKCLTDEDEIEGLIKREIDAREWFVYADSPNARASDWVRKEREYISSLGTKQIITIDLDEAGSMDDVAEKLIRGLRVLIVYGESDLPMAQRLQQIFSEKDMQAVLRTAAMADQDGSDDAGCIVVLMSRDGIRAENVSSVLADNADSEGIVVLALIDGYDISSQGDDLRDMCRAICYLRTADSKQRLEEFVRLVENEVTHDLRKAFEGATSHSEVEAFYLKNADNPEALKLAQEAQDRLDGEQRIKEDILESIERGTMKMTDELKKFLES